jgi:single-strand DNA-binding protein
MQPNDSTAVHKNEVHLAGVLAKDPQVRYTTQGKAVANLTIATRYKDATEYHRVVCWETLAEKVGPLLKGEFVRLVGRLQTRSWEDNSKIKHYSTEVVAYQLVVPSQESAPITPTLSPKITPNIHGVEVTNDDIPF